MIYHQVIFIPLRQEIHKEVTKKKKHNMENSSKPILCTIGIGHCQSHIGSKRGKIPLRKLFLKWFWTLHFFMLEVFATTLRISNFLTFSKWSIHLTKKWFSCEYGKFIKANTVHNWRRPSSVAYWVKKRQKSIEEFPAAFAEFIFSFNRKYTIQIVRFFVLQARRNISKSSGANLPPPPLCVEMEFYTGIS